MFSPPQKSSSVEELWIIGKDGKRRRAVSKVCDRCHITYSVDRRFEEASRFCTMDCARLASRRRSSQNCSLCEKEFEVQTSRLNRSRCGMHFCSRECKDRAQRVDSPCDMVLPAHYGTGESQYRKRCADKLLDGCVGCTEKRSYLLMIHHIDGDRTNNKLENLEVVCGRCHLMRHLKLVDGVWRASHKSLTPRDVVLKMQADTAKLKIR